MTGRATRGAEPRQNMTLSLHADVVRALRQHPGRAGQIVDESVALRLGLQIDGAGHLPPPPASVVARVTATAQITAPPESNPNGHPLSPAALRHYQRNGIEIPKGARIVTPEEVEAQAKAAIAETLRLAQQAGEEEF